MKKSAAPGWRVPAGFHGLKFVPFVAARQRVLEQRRLGKPSTEWTDDEVLRRARFCNIDRRDDAVTAELLAELNSAKSWSLRERALLAAALRFTSSRRGEAAKLAGLINAGTLCAELRAGNVQCGTGTYQMSLNRKQVASVIEQMADAVVSRVDAQGPFNDVLDAADFVADHMTVGKRPQFSANETAKDFAYIAGLMRPASHRRCHLGPGARKGLALVRHLDAALTEKSEADAVEHLRQELRTQPSLAWVEAIDVEQALCEYSKYDAYVTNGVSSQKRFATQAEVK